MRNASSSAARAATSLRSPSSCVAMNRCAPTLAGSISSARSTEPRATGGFSSARARAMPSRAGAHSASWSSASVYDCTASGRLYFSRNRSAHAVWMAGSSGAPVAAERSSPFACRNRPSARAARPPRYLSTGRRELAPYAPTLSRYGAASAARPTRCSSSPSSSAAALSGAASATGTSSASASAYWPRRTSTAARTAAAAGSSAARSAANDSARSSSPRASARVVSRWNCSSASYVPASCARTGAGAAARTPAASSAASATARGFTCSMSPDYMPMKPPRLRRFKEQNA